MQPASDLLDELQSCPSCESKGIRCFYSRADTSSNALVDQMLFRMLEIAPRAVRYDLCADCGLLFLNPRWNDRALARLYGQENIYRRVAIECFRIRNKRPNATELEYFRYIDETVDGPNKVHQFHYKRAAWIMKQIRNGSTRQIRVADVGAGFGAAQKALEHAGFSYRGFESSEEMVRRAKELGRTLECAPFSEVPRILAGNRVDVAYTAQFFEHVDEPVKCMSVLRDAINDDGYLFVDVPSCQYLSWKNLGSFLTTAGIRRHYMNWGHMLHFDHVSLGNAMRRAGFEPVGHRYIGAFVWVLGRKLPQVSMSGGHQKPNVAELTLNIKVLDPLFEPVNTAYRLLRQRAKQGVSYVKSLMS